MINQLFPLSLLSLGLLSAMSLTPLLTSSIPAKAQTAEPSVNVSPTVPSAPSPALAPFPSEAITEYAPNTAPMLEQGDWGKAVKDVQTYLTQQGFYTGQIDGYYGNNTVSAVRNFQQSRNLIADGRVGPRTWAALVGMASVTTPPPTVSPTVGDLSDYSPTNAPILTIGIQGDAVRDVQGFLRRRGFYNGIINGFYGPKTTQAVIDFQSRMGLNQDGIVGPRTWDAMQQYQIGMR